MSDRVAGIAPWRRRLFAAGIALICLGMVGTTLCFAAPFPLVKLPDGSLMVNPWDDRILIATVVVSLLASILVAFGRGLSRTLLIGAGPILAFIAACGYVQNHV